MNPVTQLDPFGCGVACVSFITRNSYVKVRNTLDKTQAQNRGFYCKDLIDVLDKFGFSYKYKYLKSQLKHKIYQDGVIVFIKRSRRYPFGHFLARYNRLWMDSWINFHEETNILNAKSGFRKRLPGKPIYALFPIHHSISL